MIDPPIFTDRDNETVVRESLVAPLLRALGYDEEEILPEYPLVFRFQGESKRIRADYILSVPHQYDLPRNRVVIEVKRPSIPINDPAFLEQAIFYALHQEIQAAYVVLVNGLQLNIYVPTGARLELLRSYEVGQLKEKWNDLQALLGATALRNHFAGTQILELIGEGGYGRVFKVKDIALGRLEALKVLHAGSEQTVSVRKRFAQGAKGQAVFDHPNICRVFELAFFNGRPYYRMELVPGIGLTQYLTKHQLSIAERLVLFRKICEALAHAHANDVVHCDLKPANVLVKDDGAPKLIDFDFCHLGSGASTILSQIVATIAYMDPTIWRNPNNRDQLADIYSTGLLLWSILTGKDLAPGWTSHFLLSELAAIDAEAEKFGPVILRCIQENRSARPQSIEQLLTLLGVSAWRTPLQDLQDGAISNFAAHSPHHEFEYRFRLWQQTGDLPGSADFDRLSKGIPTRALTQAEREFVFRATSTHWSVQYRSLFRGWSADDLIEAARTVLEDRRFDKIYVHRVGEAHPARQAVDLLAATDDYRGKEASEQVARFLLNRLRNESRRPVFFTTLDGLARFQCFKPKHSKLRIEVSTLLIELIEKRLPNATRDSAKDIGKLLEKLDPGRCGEDSATVAAFIGKVAHYPALRNKASKTLSCFADPAATDEFIRLLEALRGDAKEFERVAVVAIGLDGRHTRRLVAEYLAALPNYSPGPRLKQKIDDLLQA